MISENNNFAKFRLYFGIVSARGLGEGEFYLDKNEYQNKRYKEELENIQEILSRTWGLRIGRDSFVKSEEEAKFLIEFSEKNIFGTSSLIQLVDSMHGNTRFWRNILFNGWNKPQEQELIDELKKSGYQPKNEEVENLKQFSKFYEPEEFQEKLSQIDLNKPWRNALKFD